jgi:hypothetical protein
MKAKRQYRYAGAEQALEELRKEGFAIDYNVEHQEIIHNPEIFEIIYIYRYEGMSNPDDESTVYGIQNTQTCVKGVFVAGNLSFNEDDAAKVLLQLEIKGRQDELDQ